jgi:hypothetical protein
MAGKTLQKTIASRIITIRRQQVILDSDLAEFYGVEVGRLLRQVRDNRQRFPRDFVFQLTPEEWESLRSENRISKPAGRGGRRYRPYAFTEQGAIQASSVLRSERAARVGVALARAFVQMRQTLAALDNPNMKKALEQVIKEHGGRLDGLDETVKALREMMDIVHKQQKQLPPAS